MRIAWLVYSLLLAVLASSCRSNKMMLRECTSASLYRGQHLGGFSLADTLFAPVSWQFDTAACNSQGGGNIAPYLAPIVVRHSGGDYHNMSKRLTHSETNDKSKKEVTKGVNWSSPVLLVLIIYSVFFLVCIMVRILRR